MRWCCALALTLFVLGCKEEEKAKAPPAPTPPSAKPEPSQAPTAAPAPASQVEAPPPASAPATEPAAVPAPATLAVASAPTEDPPDVVVPKKLSILNVFVGKWPEGVAFADGVAWVANSGDRNVGRVGLDGKSKAEIPVGRLPVQMASDDAGKIYALVATDNKVVSIDVATRKVTEVAKLPECAQDMALREGVLYVLLLDKCSNTNSSVLRIELATKKHVRSEPLGNAGDGLDVGLGFVWVAHSTGNVQALDPVSLVKRQDIPVTGRPHDVVVGNNAVYAEGWEGEVVRIDPTTFAAGARVTIGSPELQVAQQMYFVVAVGQPGVVWFLEPDTLKPAAKLEIGVPIAPKAMVVTPDQRLLLTSHNGDEAGSLYVIEAQ